MYRHVMIRAGTLRSVDLEAGRWEGEKKEYVSEVTPGRYVGPIMR